MGYQLNKPDLRRETEHECNLVANRQKTKDDIVGPILAKMKDVFMAAAREAQKLDEAMARHFDPIGAGNSATVLQANFTECGTCQRKMALKREGGNKVLFCGTCRSGYLLPRKGEFRPKTEDGNASAAIRCPICSFQVVAVARGNGYDGNGYNLCPKCHNDPPQDHGGSRHGGNFRCFSCAHPTCALAGGTRGGDVEVFGCPFCRERGVRGGKVMLRKNTRGYILSCSNYSSRDKCGYTIWLPRASQEVSVVDGDENICTRCSTNGPVKKISFRWKMGDVPAHLGRQSTACILCDTGFRQDVQINLPSMDQVRSRNSSSNRRQYNGNGGRGNAGRGNGAGFGRGNNNNSNNRGRGGGRGWGANNNTNGYSRNGGRGNGGSTNRNGNNGITCFRCQQPGHYANSCPNVNQ